MIRSVICLSIVFMTTVSTSYAQFDKQLLGIWYRPSVNVYQMFTNDFKQFDLSIYPDEVVVSESVYGFYDNCNLSHLDSLKSEGTGKFFFIIDNHTLNEESGEIILPRLDCWSILIDHDIEDRYEPDSLYLHYRRRAIIDYVKVSSLPIKVEKFLEKNYSDIYKAYCKLEGCM